MTSPQDFFVAECAAHAKTLPLADAATYLQGLLLSCEDSPAMRDIRAAFNSLKESEAQLDLIHLGQMKLGLPHDGNGDGHHKKGDGK